MTRREDRARRKRQRAQAEAEREREQRFDRNGIRQLDGFAAFDRTVEPVSSEKIPKITGGSE